ncbi:MAG: hypothetical protein Q8R18_00360 [bacterium]|nr:hypothetical protein [bacterium]
MERKMENLTITVSKELKKEVREHKEVNWSEVLRQAMQGHLRKLEIAEQIAKKSKLTKKDILELDRMVKKNIAKAHGYE